MTADHPVKKRGGRREGAGRRPTLQPLKAVRLHDPAIREALAVLTAYEREMMEEPLWSQEDMVAELIRAAHDRHLKDQIEYPNIQNALPKRAFEYSDIQMLAMPDFFEYTDIQKNAPVRAAAPAIYQLRIVLTDIEPEIWRRVLVRSDATLAELHDIIQICFS